MANKPDTTSWFFKMTLVTVGIGLAGACADTLLAWAGFPDGIGSGLIALVCALSAFHPPKPVADPFLQWRVGAWGARVLALPLTAAGALTNALWPSLWAVPAGLASTAAGMLFVGWVVERWARWASQVHYQAYQESNE